MRVALLLVLCAAAMGQTEEPLAEITGVATDAATQLPVAGARVILVRVDRGQEAFGPELWQTQPGPGDPRSYRLAVVTGADGAFRFQVRGPVRFNLLVDCPGYVTDWATGRAAHVYESKAGPSQEPIVLRLQPVAEISGKVIDGETQQPAVGVAVMPYKYESLAGGRALAPAGRGAKVEQDGRYRLEGLAPGDYFLEVRPPLMAKVGPAPPVENFLRDVRFTYASTWYPGVARSEDATAIPLGSGARLEGIDFRIEKRRTAAIRGRVVPSEGVEEGSEVPVALQMARRQMNAASFLSVASGRVRAGAEFEIGSLLPGTYWLTARTGEGTEARTAILTFRLEDQNVDGLDLRPSRGITLAGRVRVEGREEGSDNAFPKGYAMVALFTPLVRAPFPDERPSQVDPLSGRFTRVNMIPDKYRLSLTGGPPGFKVSEVRYNGGVCPYGVVEINQGAADHTLEIVIAQANGSLAATVTDGTRGAPRATVILAAEPVGEETPDFALLQARAGEDGKARFTGLLPGVYRMTAYAEGAEWMLDPLLKRRLADGTQVRLGGNATSSAEVRVQSSP